MWVFLILSLAILRSGHAQGLQSGNLLGVHVITVTLKPGVTIDQFQNFYVHEVLPEYEKRSGPASRDIS